MTAPAHPNSPDDRPGRTGRTTLIVAFLLAALIALAMVAILRRGGQSPAKPDAEPAEASRAEVDAAMTKLRAADWLNFDGVAKADLERRLFLLDAAIYATDAYSGAVDRLDPRIAENQAAFARRDAFNTRGRVLRTGRRAVDFLREHFGRWQFDPVAGNIRFENDALFEQFAAIQRELQDAAEQGKADVTGATTVPATSPTSAPATAPATKPATLPVTPATQAAGVKQ